MISVEKGKGSDLKGKHFLRVIVNKKIFATHITYKRLVFRIYKMKRQHTEWKEIFANHIFNKELISKIHLKTHTTQ